MVQWQWCGRGKRVASGQEKDVDSWEGRRGKKIKEENKKSGNGFGKSTLFDLLTDLRQRQLGTELRSHRDPSGKLYGDRKDRGGGQARVKSRCPVWGLYSG